MTDSSGGDAISQLIARLESYSQSDGAFASTVDVVQDDPEWPRDIATRRQAAAQLSEELMALQSIYTDEALHLLRIAPPGASPNPTGSSAATAATAAATADPQDWLPGSRVTLALSTEIEPHLASPSAADPEPVPIRIAITLPAFYPHSSKPPQLQLLSRYIAGFGVDHSLFGEILRAFYHQKESNDSRGGAADLGASDWIGGSMSQGVNWSTGEVILFEGIEWVKEKVSDWWIEREQSRLTNANDRGLDSRRNDAAAEDAGQATHDEDVTAFDADEPPKTSASRRSSKGQIIQADPISDRKSVFVGYAARIRHPDEVPEVLSQILSDRRVAKAAHPTINAWVCQTNDGVIHRDCDDDGESAAGGRLAHLLSLLEVNNVIVVVTRWFGGIHLGADRFKLINRAARDALELAGMVAGPLNPSPDGGKADTKGGKAGRRA
ncbi:uncharacterized protein PFL1_05070 [Pseudozyma flocculosa PF-1]|uniref:Related to YIH1 n=2 Tax=Pseudozyma flocculosa TaxID=84751 RepID=A0A5C3EUT5_9BASI|nr:uncharacterized protein PFL1_05070 [Pseudozyma flocculosa PF-1]EPQ27532.1 hypothetical protein PFL1_05070 [Pseudozyma flocculosa PF-1]SPO36033.1 related to YIH1 [Pseudozyma flocculosa]